MVRKTNKDSRIGSKTTRRNILRSVGFTAAAGISTGVVGSARAYKDTVTIVTHKAGDKVVNTKKVPRNWKDMLILQQMFEQSLVSNTPIERILVTFPSRHRIINLEKDGGSVLR